MPLIYHYTIVQQLGNIQIQKSFYKIVGFSFLSWNIKQFRGSSSRTKKVEKLIKKYNPDIFGILEFSDKKVARKLASENFRQYNFGITESRGQMEITIAYKRRKFDQVLFTQRREFKAGSIHLRPGAILSVRQKRQKSFDNILFLHTDSGTKNSDYKNRQTMFTKIWHLKRGLENLPIQKRKARLLIIGDLNTMGKNGISAKQEITKLKNDAQNNGMIFLDKSHKKTWSNSNNRQSDLDHCMISDDLQTQQWYFQENPDVLFPIIVDGWIDLKDSARKNFIKNISDHSLLYGEIL